MRSGFMPETACCGRLEVAEGDLSWNTCEHCHLSRPASKVDWTTCVLWYV